MGDHVRRAVRRARLFQSLNAGVLQDTITTTAGSRICHATYRPGFGVDVFVDQFDNGLAETRELILRVANFEYDNDASRFVCAIDVRDEGDRLFMVLFLFEGKSAVVDVDDAPAVEAAPDAAQKGGSDDAQV